MGLLVNGNWQDQWYDTKASKGEFVREDSKFHNKIVPNPSSTEEFQAESGRYHLFVSLACPWAHRTLIFRKLKKLENVISVTTVKADMMEFGWEFKSDDTSLSELNLNSHYLHQVYTTSKPDYTGRVTVPVLWDKINRVIVNNESSHIIRFFNKAFDAFTPMHYDFYPEDRQREIDEVNDLVYHNINNGVYKCGFATTQTAYEKAYDNLFAALDTLELKLENQRFLVGDSITEADWRLFTTLVRFDPVYFSHFKTNKKRIADYHNLFNYLKELYQVPGISETVDIEHIKRHYYYSHESINPKRIVPKGPLIELEGPHDRNRFSKNPVL